MPLASAELPTLARHPDGPDGIAATRELLVDTVTASAVKLDDTGRNIPRQAARPSGLRDELARRHGGVRLRLPDLTGRRVAPAGPGPRGLGRQAWVAGRWGLPG